MSLKRQLAEEEGFLGRWSRLKRERQSPAEDEAPISVEPAPPTEPIPIEEPATADDEARPATPLPDIATLGPGSDFRPFMQAHVAPDLRAQALKKLWASNPLYNHIDMLDDYCEDYTDKAMVVPGMKTAYKVGRGFLKSAQEVADKLDDNSARTATEIAEGKDDDEIASDNTAGASEVPDRA